MDQTHPPNRLRENRISKGLNQVELAAKASVSVSLISQLENGRRISRRKKIKVASALGLEVGQVFPEEASDATPPLAPGR